MSGSKAFVQQGIPRLVTQPTKGSRAFVQPRILGLVTQPKLLQGFQSICPTKALGNKKSTHNHTKHKHQLENKMETPEQHDYPWNGKVKQNHYQYMKLFVPMPDRN